MVTDEQVQDTVDVNTALDRRLHEAAVRIFKQARKKLEGVKRTLDKGQEIDLVSEEVVVVAGDAGDDIVSKPAMLVDSLAGFFGVWFLLT